MLSQLGGIYNSLFTIGFLFSGAFNYNLFLSSIISKLYYFKARFDSEISHKKDKKKKKGDKSDSKKKSKPKDNPSSGVGGNLIVQPQNQETSE